ncbi:Low temperature viability protein-domain-containing protein [Panaeolus papilionaceus]|nr:Low temperature viability protein-domain-containing protein [Panaeolus papilionaceus]
MPPKSIFRQPGAKHFQLVHRSQRDPLINDPEASKHVLKPFERDNAKKGKLRSELETLLAEESTNHRQNVGEASLYGVYFDDTEYDYMQHLRPVGVQEDGVDSVLIEAPATSKPKSKARKGGLLLSELPDGVLASEKELPRNYETQQAIPSSLTGFQPDMDAHLRQVLEALEDDAFVDDDLEDDFFGELVADGERGSDEDVEFEFAEEGIPDNQEDVEDGVEEESEETWQKRFADFKKSRTADVDSNDECSLEGRDTVSNLPEVKVIGGKGKKRKKGSSEASGYSMSSSSMYRNEALQTLDERFDQMILKQYNEDDDDEGFDDESIPDDDDNEDEAPDLITSRDDFDSMINEFLNDYEILGRKMKLKLDGETGPEKLDSFRRAMGQDERVRIASEEDREDNDDDLFPSSDDEKKDRWDCETILTTYTNVENHPRLIRARTAQPVPKIILDPKTGFPVVNGVSTKPSKLKPTPTNGDDSDTSTENTQVRRETITRPKNETKEEKKARKAAVKAERQERRSTKKSMKEQFNAEVTNQNRQILNKELRLKKL